MARFIDAENVKAYIFGQFVDRIRHDILDAVVDGVDDIESEDLEPVIHAGWIEQYDAGGKFYMCSNCVQSTNYKENYCPNCGAKMDEKKGD